MQRRLVERWHSAVRAAVRRGAVFVRKQQNDIRLHRVLVQDAVLPVARFSARSRLDDQAAVQVRVIAPTRGRRCQRCLLF